MPTFKPETEKREVPTGKGHLELTADEKRQGYKIKTIDGETQGRTEFVTIPAGTEAFAAALASAYGMTIDRARTIVADRKKDPNSHPYELGTKAEAMIAAFEATPSVIAVHKKPYKRVRTFYGTRVKG